MPLAVRLVLAVTAGLAVGISFEPLGLAYLLPFTVAGLTLLLGGVSYRQGFLLGSAFGASFMLVLLPWMQVIGVDAWILLSVVEGSFYGLLGLGTVAVVRLPWWPLWAASLWVAVEAVRGSFPFGGFPWGRLAFATVDTPVAPLFAYLGAAGVTFVVALTGTTLAWAVSTVRRTPAAALSAVAAVAVLATSGAVVPLDQPASAADGDRDEVTVAAVQGNVPGEGMDAFAERRAVLDNHVSATKEYAARLDASGEPRPAFVVWPENSTDIDPFADPTAYADIQSAVDAIGVPVLVGAMVSGDEPHEVYNQGIVWHPESGPGERYSKNHPVPFGEYIPFRDLIAPFFSRLDQIPRDMVPGTEPGLLDMGEATIGGVICFEVAHDDLLREVVEQDSGLIVVQTNNATYMGTGQIEQQFAITRLRAIETGKYVVVAATNGVSGIVDPDGEVVTRAATRTQDVLTETLTLRPGSTAGVAWGPRVEWLLTAAGVGSAALALALHYRRARRPEPAPAPEPVATSTGE